MEEKIQTCLEHIKLNVSYKDERYGVQTFRKHYSGYLKGLPNISQVRSELMTYTHLEEVEKRLNQYMIEAKDVVDAKV